ncbi:MAG: hypothetical protein CM1200mP16_02070 [Nitrospina sp.]|nr:MAG: hypothetical protein CM1200mP16_02070 [Nitrospina sp.]
MSWAVIHDLKTDEIYTLRADAVVLATGGPGQVYGRSTNSVSILEQRNYRLFQGLNTPMENLFKFIPPLFPVKKIKLMSESARGEGGRIWVPLKANDSRDPKKIPSPKDAIFLKKSIPYLKTLFPRDVASREIYDIVYNQKMGISGNQWFILI